LIISRNITSHDFQLFHAKGLGTSASGGAAIARAAFNILYHSKEITQNSRLFSIFSRYLSGSASRSSVGGIGLWLSHPECDTRDSFALRLDRKENSRFIQNISLLTIPLQSSNTTSNAHEIAPKSPLYTEWCLSRKKKIIQFLNAFQKHDFRTIGKLTEEDSKSLHKIHTSVPQGRPYWNKKTEKIMKITHFLRDKGIPVYFSVDTGPSVVLLTQNEFVNEVIDYIQSNISSTVQIIKGYIQGQSKLMRSNSKLYHILDDDIAKFQN
jgi:diphosphomevalonate decarboxylase